MYRWVAVGCAVGFGLGLLFITFIFEMTLSPYGSPVTVDTGETEETWDWNAQTNTWKFIGIMWILVGLVALYIIYRGHEKPAPLPTPKRTAKT